MLRTGIMGSINARPLPLPQIEDATLRGDFGISRCARRFSLSRALMGTLQPYRHVFRFLEARGILSIG